VTASGRYLTFTRARLDMSGTYTCTASNAYGTDSQKSYVRVSQPITPGESTLPDIQLGGSQVIDAPLGSTVDITCSVSSLAKIMVMRGLLRMSDHQNKQQFMCVWVKVCFDKGILFYIRLYHTNNLPDRAFDRPDS